MSDQVARLQSAVREILYELNIYQEQENIGRVREVALDTLETYGLTKEDMEWETLRLTPENATANTRSPKPNPSD